MELHVARTCRRANPIPGRSLRVNTEQSPTLYLELLNDQPAGARTRLPVGGGVIRLGRAPDSDLVLAESTVSWMHATLWVDRGAVRVRDHHSTNGTWIDGRRLAEDSGLEPGQTLRLGERVELRLVHRGGPPPRAVTWRVEVIESGLSVPLPPDGLVFGLGDGVNVSVPLADISRFEVHPDGNDARVEVVGQPSRRARAGEPFTVGGLHFRLLPADGPPVPTVGQQVRTDRYRLTVAQGSAGVEARLEDPGAGLSHRIEAENRAALLFVLAERLIEDRAARLPPDQQGWCTDDALAHSIWGREAGRMEANNLNVLLHRLRRELEDAGFDVSFLEKRRRATRARLVHVARS